MTQAGIRPARSRKPPNGLLLLILAALIGSWLAGVVTAEGANPELETDQESKSAAYHVTHGLSLLAVLSASVVGIIRGRLRLVHGTGRMALLVLIAAAVIWALAAYDASELFSTKVVGVTGPFVWITLMFALAGMDRRIWRTVGSAICALAYLTTLLACWNLVRSAEFGYVAAYTSSAGYCVLLMWTGGWTLLTATRIRGWQLVVRCAPMAVMFLTAVQSQARSWTIQAILVGLLFLVLRGREQGSLMLGLQNAGVAIVFGLGVVAMFLAYTRSGLTNQVADRVFDDTRSVQYHEFFHVVPVSDLALGRGPKGTWYWFGFGEYQFFDNGYLWMLFIGGVPTLAGYVVFVLFPAIGALRRRVLGADMAAACLVLFWGLALTGLSTFTLPSVAFASYVMSLWVGRCYLVLAEAALQRKRTAMAMLRQRTPQRFARAAIAAHPSR